MNRDHDHDIADMLVRQANTKRDRLKAWEKEGLEIIDMPLSTTVPEQNSKHYRDCQYANCWCKAEPEAWPIPPALPKEPEEPETTDIDIIRGLVRVIDYHLEAVGDMVCDERVLTALLTQAKQRLKETKDADLLGYPVLEDRYCELLRLGQGDLAEPDFMGGSEPLQFGDPGLTSTEPDSFPQSCPCPTCSGDGWED